jgi:uncharacterized protein YbaA (DUF1428 family)
MTYVNGMVAAVPNTNKGAYEAMARDMKPVFIRHGATQVVDCWGDDVPAGEGTSFPKAVQCKADETVAFSWISWPDKTTAEQGMKAAMVDPEMVEKMGQLPFDGNRLIYGGFEQIET